MGKTIRYNIEDNFVEDVEYKRYAKKNKKRNK